MGGMGGGGGFQGSVGGVSDPGLSQPTYMPGGGSTVAPPNPMNIPRSSIAPQAGISMPSRFKQFQNSLGQVVNAAQPLMAAIPGTPQNQQGQQQRQQPVSFNIPYQPYIPPPGSRSNNGY